MRELLTQKRGKVQAFDFGPDFSTVVEMRPRRDLLEPDYVERCFHTVRGGKSLMGWTTKEWPAKSKAQRPDADPFALDDLA
jgi:hypothetical protein